MQSNMLHRKQIRSNNKHFGLLGVVVEEEIASAEYFSFQIEKRITRNYATIISVFRFDAAQGSRFCNAG
jgi:hypothetical protein